MLYHCSMETENKFTELARIQRELNAPKTLYNKFGEYYYRSAETILEAVKPLLNGCLLYLDDDIVEVGGRVYVKATATFMEPSGIICTHAFAREQDSRKGMDEAQITGSTSSYARKYALNALFLIDDVKDPDDKVPDGKEPQKDLPITKEQRDKIDALLKTKIVAKEIQESLVGLTQSRYDNAIKYLEKCASK